MGGSTGTLRLNCTFSDIVGDVRAGLDAPCFVGQPIGIGASFELCAS